MGLDLKAIIGSLGPTALSLIPGVGPVLGGIAKVASAIGGDTGKKIEDGIQGLSQGLSDIGKQPLTPDQQVELEKAKMETEVQLRNLDFQDKKLTYDDQAGGRDIIKTALLSDDPYVRRARPRMMVALGYMAMGYTIGTPLLLTLCGALKMEKELLVNLCLWQGGTIWAAFITSFTGYTVARSADKRTASYHALGIDPSKMLQLASKIGAKIS